MSFSDYKKELLVVFALLILFVLSGYLAQVYQDQLVGLMSGRTVSGALVYVFGATIATIIAPLSFLPILPVAVTLWGSFVAALLSIVAWSLGAAIAFLLARRYGRPLVLHFVGERKMSLASRMIPEKYLFVAVVFLRMALPVDLLSYALGLLGVMRFMPYMAATVIGITPFAFAFSYLAQMSFTFQAISLIVGVSVIVLGLPYINRRYKEIFQ